MTICPLLRTARIKHWTSRILSMAGRVQHSKWWIVLFMAYMLIGLRSICYQGRLSLWLSRFATNLFGILMIRRAKPRVAWNQVCMPSTFAISRFGMMLSSLRAYERWLLRKIGLGLNGWMIINRRVILCNLGCTTSWMLTWIIDSRK